MTKKQSNILAFIIPIIIFLICIILNRFYPFGKYSLLFSDADVQYPAFYLALKDFTPFSLKVGFGFNFYATALYYLMSPLNILIYFFKPNTYIYFFIITIIIKIGLSSLFMNILLNYKSKNKYTYIFSTIYALNGYILTYFINSMWIDSLYMLPLVMLGIKKIIEENKCLLYYISLTLSIIFNYYIGYMICIFSLLFFIYEIINTKEQNKKQKIKLFIIFSILSGLTTAFVLLPAYNSLMLGKVNDFASDKLHYFNFNKNIKYLFSNLSPFFLIQYGQELKEGTAQIYCTLGLIILLIIILNSNKITKKQRLTTIIFITLYLVSFSFNLLDYSWQMFQQPYWFNHRYSFTLIAFIIYFVSNNIENITQKNIIRGIYLIILFVFLILFSSIFKYFDYKANDITYFILSTLSIIILSIIYIFCLIKDKKKLYVIILFLEIFIFTFYSLSKHLINKVSPNIDGYQSAIVNKDLEQKINKYKGNYRIELTKHIGYNDGLYYNYNGITNFNSIRNENIVNLFDETLNQLNGTRNSIVFDYFDSYLMSLFNIKYLISEKEIYKNEYPLGIGYIVSNEALNIKLNGTYKDNIQEIISKFTGNRDKIYTNLEENKILNKETFNYGNNNITTIKVKLNNDTILINNNGKTSSSCVTRGNNNYLSIENNCIRINNKDLELPVTPINIKKEDELELSIIDYKKDSLILIDGNVYKKNMEKLSKNLLNLEDLKGMIDIENDSLLFISIPKENGLTVLVDEKNTDTYKVLDTFIGIPLTKGKHKIEIIYNVPGLKSGLIISIGSLLITIYLLIKLKKNNKSVIF